MGKVTFMSASISWTVKEMIALVEEGKIGFDNAVQRGNVWDNARSSYLIDSVLQGYVIPPMYAKKGDDNSYDMLDGKQRCHALISFVRDEYALENMSEGMEDYEGLTFSQLEEREQDAILSFVLKVTYLDGISDDEIREVFYRLNNGKPLTSFEQSRAKAKSLATIQSIASSDLFSVDKTGKSYVGYKKEELVFKMWMMLYMETPALEARTMNKLLPVTEISEDEEIDLMEICDTLFSVAESVKNDKGFENPKIATRIYKRILTPTHMLTLVPLIKRALDEDRSEKEIRAWLEHFYSGKKRASVDERYNDHAVRGSGHASSVKIRLECLTKSYDDFMNAEKTELPAETETETSA